LPPLPQT
ncbi:hypothetical protein ECEC1848_4477, partial [Escherichia coli EC1848]